MKLFIPKDMLDNPKPPRMFLCTTDKRIIGELPSYDESLDGKWGSYSEIQFSIDRQYVDVLTGELKTYPTFDKAEGLRKVYVENIGYFIIQDPDVTYGEKDTKTLSCFSGEYETANKYLENFRVNTGEIDSKEVIALESIHGYNYTIDPNNLYKLASGIYDPYESYYIMEYDNNSYTYEQISIEEDEYAEYINKNNSTDSQPHERLYVNNYPNVRFYFPSRPELSLLHLIFDKIPGWKIGNVDVNLWRKERTFNKDRIAVYDFLMNEVQDTFKCAVEWDTLTYTVNFYEETEDGITEDNEVQSRWETDVFVSRDNLANEISINYSTDDIKTKLKVSGSDNLDIREVNLGRNYIMNLSYYHNLDWMEQDLFEKYNDYLETVKEYTPKYTEVMQNWVGANNKYNDLMNAVPAEGNVVLIDDEFKKLYCIYKPVNTAYYDDIIKDENIGVLHIDAELLYLDEEYTKPIDISALHEGDILIIQGYTLICTYNEVNGFFFKVAEKRMETVALDSLIKKLTLYHVNEDIDANNPDNYLLRLSNANSDMVSIRIYNASEKNTKDEKIANPDYKIQVVTIYAQSGIESSPKIYSIDEWVRGELTAEYMGLEDYKVKYIGIMGAYFVLAKDERQEEVLEEYGVNLLKSKHETYIKIFQTQTEAMLSQEKYQCIAQDTQPEGDFNIGTRWLDTDSSPAKLYQYSEVTDGNGEVKKEWKLISGEISESDQMNYENYQRYIDNYEKMIAVQNVLIEKEKQAIYMRDGYGITNRNININLYTKSDDGILRYNGQTLEGDMHRVAEIHFVGHSIARQSFDQDLPIYYFSTSYDVNKRFAVYLKGTTPYISYADSQGVYETIMNWITNKTDFEKFFTEDQWIRLSPFIREDEFSDSNFLLTGYESEEERLKICKELFENANKELNTLCQPSLEFSMNMANILALPEFELLINQFQLGNFIRIHIRDGYVKRSRLLEVHLNFSDLSDFSCNFGNLITTKSEIDKHAELLSQAVTAGKQVATSAGDWQRAVDKSNKLEEDISNGLADATLEIGKASGQSIVWGDYGIWGRKLIDGTTDQYDPEQFRIINNKLLFSNDGFKTSKAVFGKYIVDGQERWGPLAEYVTAGYIEGSSIVGGSLKIGGDGGTFIVHEDGSVQILAADAKTPVYATKTDVDLISEASQYRIELLYDSSTIFGQPGQECVLTCKVYKWDEDVTSKLPSGTVFSWLKNGVVYKTTNTPTLTVTNKDIERNAIFSCSITFDETQIK